MKGVPVAVVVEVSGWLVDGKECVGGWMEEDSVAVQHINFFIIVLERRGRHLLLHT